MEKFTLALVTGASSGIGEALCRLLAGQGINLILHGRNLEKLNLLAAELREKIIIEIAPGDLSNKVDREFLIAKIHERCPDLIVNNAGFGLYGHPLCHQTEDLMQIIEVNASAVIEITLEAARTLFVKKKHGVILNVSSAAGFQIAPGLSVYGAAKAFITHFSESFDIEMRPYGVRVLTSCPGVVDTNFSINAGGKSVRDAGRPAVMDKEFAANEIWKQIIREQPVHIFDWRYRLAIAIAKIVPKTLIAKVMLKNIEGTPLTIKPRN